MTVRKIAQTFGLILEVILNVLTWAEGCGEVSSWLSVRHLQVSPHHVFPPARYVAQANAFRAVLENTGGDFY
jgi:hypothetical protein